MYMRISIVFKSIVLRRDCEREIYRIGGGAGGLRDRDRRERQR